MAGPTANMGRLLRALARLGRRPAPPSLEALEARLIAATAARLEGN